MLIVHQGEFSSVRQLFAERFKFSLKNWIANTKETEVVTTTEDFISKLGLSCRQSQYKVIVC